MDKIEGQCFFHQPWAALSGSSPARLVREDFLEVKLQTGPEKHQSSLTRLLEAGEACNILLKLLWLGLIRTQKKDRPRPVSQHRGTSKSVDQQHA